MHFGEKECSITRGREMWQMKGIFVTNRNVRWIINRLRSIGPAPQGVYALGAIWSATLRDDTSYVPVTNPSNQTHIHILPKGTELVEQSWLCLAFIIILNWLSLVINFYHIGHLLPVIINEGDSVISSPFWDAIKVQSLSSIWPRQMSLVHIDSMNYAHCKWYWSRKRTVSYQL